MSANISASPAPNPRVSHTDLRVVSGLLGAATLALGIVLLFNPTSAAHLLSVLIGIAFIIGGVLEIAVGWSVGSRLGAAVLGAVLVIGGTLAVAWPKVTLWTVALIVGLSLILHGIGRVAVAVTERHSVPSWEWFAAVGVLNVVVGVLAIAWPHATVLVLAVILGIQIVLFGALLLAVAFAPSLAASRPRHGLGS
jgi:uncharacterized membrane protein HdeD (DUF308 family)